MSKCSRCGFEFDGKFCPQCGQKIKDISICEKCGAPIEDGDKYCKKCGRAVPAKNRKNKVLGMVAKILMLVTVGVLAVVGIFLMIAGVCSITAGVLSSELPANILENIQKFVEKVMPAEANFNVITLSVGISWLIVGFIFTVQLAWGLPMTLKVWHSVNRYEPLSKKFKILTIIFVSVPAGILLLCMKDTPATIQQPATATQAAE